jgi:iron complex transport system substrate-binding protein
MKYFFAALLGWVISVQGAGVTVTDDRGKTILLPAPAQRIIALAPSITELVYAAGAGERLVGVARYSDYPSAAPAVPQIGDASSIDIERVLSLRPDLVIGWRSGNHVDDVARLERFGLPVFMAEPATLAAIPRLLRTLGVMTGAPSIAHAAADDVERGIDNLRKRFGDHHDVRVFYEIWHSPLMTVNGSHMINDVIRLCGGSNVFAELAPLTPVVALEGVLAARPDVVLGGGSASGPEDFAVQWRRNQIYHQLRSVPALYIDPDLIQRQTPRILQGAETICRHLEYVRSDRR